MKKLLYLLITVAGIFILNFFMPKTFSEARADLDGDGVLDTVKLSYERGRIYISISSLNRVLVKKDFTAIKPESVKVCEIDGKSPKEIFLAVRKSTLFHKEVKLRPFFLQYDGEKIIRKWTGSKFGEDFKDVFFIDCDRDGRDEIYTIDMKKNGKESISLHYWFLFGFIKAGESSEYEKILSCVEKDGELMTRFEENGKVMEEKLQLIITEAAKEDEEMI